jgi:hypothetical protein
MGDFNVPVLLARTSAIGVAWRLLIFCIVISPREMVGHLKGHLVLQTVEQQPRWGRRFRLPAEGRA